MAPPKSAQEARSVDSRPTVAELHGDNHYAQLAKKNWLKASGPSRFNPELLKSGVWDPLEKEGFQFRSLLILENLLFLEKYVSDMRYGTLLTDSQLPMAQLYGGFL
jgi:intron-binding protein aquarius